MAKRSTRVHPDKALAHIAKLRKDGASILTIANAAGLHTTVFHRLMNGAELIDRETQNKILKVKKADLGYRVSVVGTRRKLQAIARLGYTVAETSEGTGLTKALITHIRTHQSETTGSKNLALVDAYYQKVKDVPAPPGAPGIREHIITLARKNGWAPPQAWEGRDIDDPAVGPGDYDVEQ